MESRSVMLGEGGVADEVQSDRQSEQKRKRTGTSLTGSIERGEFPLLAYRTAVVPRHSVVAPSQIKPSVLKPLQSWKCWTFSRKKKKRNMCHSFDGEPCSRAVEQLIKHRLRSVSHDPDVQCHAFEEQNGDKMKQVGWVGCDSSTLIYNPLLIESCFFHWLMHTPSGTIRKCPSNL